MKRKYKTVLNEVFVNRDVKGEKTSAGYKLFERKRSIHLAPPTKSKQATDLQLWSLR
ncbi:hypothetical protein PAMC26510_27230 [Caballeronia sordidicola]|jgi:hypothetical protein|uniref:Uncharacterized protein n=1 Tax=Caballeronia sordidicola TaxID=196367 RepID=A0A242MYS5_CABSO|nr:hypothetical protein PAMC26510_27230 [Caballeronia sordidicola]OTP76555.1 hypothetical protein PAMC26577_09890 [Caballeronia sordidicola]